jgi:lipoic acid synthetase
MATAPELIQIEIGPRRPAPKPEWLKARAPMGENYHNLKTLARNLELNTVCESAHCPNIGECWNHRTATFMLLGNLCTRRCGFCAVPKGRPQPIDFEEPRRVAEAVEKLGLKFAVVTSVNRDDDNVGGARVFANTIREIRQRVPGCRVEVLIPDFQGLEEPLRIVMDAKPDILNHNTETVPRLYRVARSGARYERTLRLLQRAKEMNPAIPTKTGVMVGLGESTGELLEVFRDLAAHHVDILTIGQYLRPSRDHLPVARLYTPDEFRFLKAESLKMGFRHVESGPLVRSSYHADEQADAGTRGIDSRGIGCSRSEQFSELLDGESGVADNAAHREGIHRVVARNGKNALTVSHHDMFALAQNTETRLLQSAYRLKVGNSGNFAH